MRWILLFYCLWAVAAHSAPAAKTPRAFTSDEVPLQLKPAPLAVLAAIPVSADWHYNFACRTEVEGQEPFWLVFYHWKSSKPKPGGGYSSPPDGNAHRLFIVERSHDAKNKKLVLANQIGLPEAELSDNSSWPDRMVPRVYWLQPEKKRGHILWIDLNEHLLVFPQGLTQRKVVEHFFERQIFGLNYSSYYIDGVDLQGYIRVRQLNNTSEGEGMVSSSQGNLWLWNGRGWTEQKESKE